jgi:L-rhamnose-H+ transport protein
MSFHGLAGIGYIVVAGVAMGCSILPMKYATKWKWENIWMGYIGFAQVILPCLVILITIPQPWKTYREATLSAILSAVLLGLGWGIGNTLSGIGYALLGIGLGTSIVLGLTAAIGSLLPLIILFPGRLESRAACLVYVGIVVTILGLILSAHAGRLRQEHRPKGETTSSADIKAFGKGDIRLGMVVCIASGILSSMLNLALVFGDNIRLAALRRGATQMGAVNLLWLPVEIAGFLPTLFYCMLLFRKNKSWAYFRCPGALSHWLIAILMGALFLTGLSVYGLGTAHLGEMGAILGFPVFMSTVVITSNTAGLITGEWRDSPRSAYLYGLSGLLLLLSAIVIIGWGKSSLL